MSDLVRQLRKRIWAIHLVGPETVAVDISHIVKEAADRIEELESYTKQLLAEKDLLREEYIARQEWAATQSIAVIDELKAENKTLKEIAAKAERLEREVAKRVPPTKTGVPEDPGRPLLCVPLERVELLAARLVRVVSRRGASAPS